MTSPDAAFGLLSDLIAAHARRAPQRLALAHGERTLTYAELDARVDRAAAALQREGVRAGGAVAICAASSIDYMVIFLAALRAGLAAAPLAPSSTPEQLAAMIADCGAPLLFLDAGVAAHLAPVRDRISAAPIALDGAADAGRAFEAWLAPEGAQPQPVTITPEQPFNIIYSSGTTGAPKGIVQSHAMRWAHFGRATAFGYDEAAVTLVSTGLYSNTTLVSILPALAGGGAAVLMEKFDAGRFLELSARWRVTHAMLVPVQYNRILEHPDFPATDLSSYRMKFCTSAPFSAAMKAEALKRWPGGLVEYYGMTEGGGTCILLAHLYPDKLHTVGQPAPGHDIRLIDEAGREVSPGEVGEIVGRSGAMMNGYNNLPEKTAETIWISPEGERFIRTGDMGRFDADGFLTLMDRKKDMIISGGFNIYPVDLEAALCAHPAVYEAAVVAAPSPEWGETPVAFVALTAGAVADAEELRAFANARLGKTQRISQVRLVEALPRSHIGKVLKKELRDAL